jgi:hypothetical protein
MLERELLNMMMPTFRTFGAMIGLGFGIANPINGTDNNKLVTGIVTAGICTRYPALSIFPLFFDKRI